MSSSGKQLKTSESCVGAQKSRKNESPKWKNPQDLFRKHLLRKTSSRRLITETANASTSSSNLLLQSEVYTESQPASGLYGCKNAMALRTKSGSNPFKRTSPRKRTPVKRYGSMCFGSQQQQRNEPPKIRRRTSLRFDDDDGAVEEVDSESRRAEFSCQQQESVFREIAENEQRQDELTRRRGETAKGRSKTVSSMWDVENLSELYPAVDFSSLVSTSNTSPSALLGNSFSSSPPTTTSTPKSTMSDLRRLDDFLNTRRRRCQAKPGETPELPCDLRLGLKLRLESRKPFPWMVTTAPNQQAPTQRKYPIRLSGLEQDMAIRMFSGSGCCCCCGSTAGTHTNCVGNSLKAEQGVCATRSVSIASHLSSASLLEAPDLLASNMSSCQSASHSQSGAASKCTSLSRLQSAIMYWQYPNFPWQKMFPRLDGLTQRPHQHQQQQQQLSNIPGQNIANSREAVGTGAASVPIPTLQALGSVFVNAVAEQWTQAFEQLFHSWKKGARQNFYLCASQMTLLFLKIPPRETTTIAALPDVDDESTCSSWRISPSGETFRVIITPTTLGFREKLRNEGISYRMLSARRTATASGRLSRLVSSVATDEMVVHPPSSGRILARSESQPAHQALASFHLDDRENSDLDKSSPSNFGDSIVTAEQEEGEGDENESPDKLNISDDADNVAWLKEIGISPASTRHLTKHLSMTSMSNRSGASSDSGGGRSHSGATPLGLADDSAKSTIVVEEPSSIQALYNLVNTSKIFRPIIGSHAGLPPTLLSAQPFVHAALCTLNKSSHMVKKRNNEEVYVCEFDNGPIMPHMIPKLIDFVGSCWSGEENGVEVLVSGRSCCQGFNGCDLTDNFVDLNDFVYNCTENCVLY